jgi:N-glycosylase/DNA lyase
MKKLITEYKNKKPQIKKRLREFKVVGKSGGADIFSELCFCILTPQAKAVYCNKAVEDLRKSGLLFKGCSSAISKRLKGRVRFHNNKAAYLVSARKIFSDGKGLEVKSKLDAKDVLKTRDWLVKNIKGLGYKEASHFLRNIGLGRDIAIIDRHILENLRKYGVIRKIPASISRKKYLAIEGKVKKFSKQVNIPMDELDLLFWSGQTGFIFK